MSTSTTMGFMPRLLPVTGSFILPFALLNLGLNYNCLRVRISNELYYGDYDKNRAKPTDDAVLLATSAHRNFCENVPLAFIMAGLIELNGGNKTTLAYALGVLFAARISHAAGFLSGIDFIYTRLLGYYSTNLLLGFLASWSGYLVKGYWGY